MPPNPLIYQSSPNWSIDRTFQVKFTIPTFTKVQKPKKSKSQKQYANPIILAIKWQEAINRGEYSSPADLSRKLRISRARVTQFFKIIAFRLKSTTNSNGSE